LTTNRRKTTQKKKKKKKPNPATTFSGAQQQHGAAAVRKQMERRQPNHIKQPSKVRLSHLILFISSILLILLRYVVLQSSQSFQQYRSSIILIFSAISFFNQLSHSIHQRLPFFLSFSTLFGIFRFCGYLSIDLSMVLSSSSRSFIQS
jgi:hypothetical protein